MDAEQVTCAFITHKTQTDLLNCKKSVSLTTKLLKEREQDGRKNGEDAGKKEDMRDRSLTPPNPNKHHGHQGNIIRTNMKN